MKLDETASQIIISASTEAHYRNHEYVTPEHILYASLFFASMFLDKHRVKDMVHSKIIKIFRLCLKNLRLLLPRLSC